MHVYIHVHILNTLFRKVSGWDRTIGSIKFHTALCDGVWAWVWEKEYLGNSYWEIIETS